MLQIPDDTKYPTRWAGCGPLDTIPAVLEISRAALAEMIGLALDEYPLEACGLITGPPRPVGERVTAPTSSTVARTSPSPPGCTRSTPRTICASNATPTIATWEINGVVHSHTHSEPYPSPTDVAAAPDPDWHYVIISLKRESPEVRSYRIVDGEITSEPIAIR